MNEAPLVLRLVKMSSVAGLLVGLLSAGCAAFGAELPLDSFPIPGSTDRLELHTTAAGDTVLKLKEETSGRRVEICNLGAYPMQTQPVFSHDGSAFAFTWGSRSAGTDVVFFVRSDGHFVRSGSGDEPNPLRYLEKAVVSELVTKTVMRSVNHLYVRILGWKPDSRTIRLLVEGDGDLNSFCVDEDVTKQQMTCQAMTKDDVAPFQPIVSAFSTAAAAGTGWLVSPSGMVLTCAHIVWGADRVRVDHGGRSYFVKALVADQEQDVALLQIEDTAVFPFLPLAASDSVALGTKCFTVGFPMTLSQGFSPKFTEGSISALSGMDDQPRFFQISIPIQPGNSGGVVVTEDGRAVAMVASILLRGEASRQPPPQNVNYAIKTSSILALLTKVGRSLPKPTDAKRSREEAIKLTTDATVRLVVYKSPP